MYTCISIKTLDRLIKCGLIEEYKIDKIEGQSVWITLIYHVGCIKYYIRYNGIYLLEMDYEYIKRMIIRNMVENYEESLLEKVEDNNE